jgi:ABC-2 type transport system permease protein
MCWATRTTARSSPAYLGSLLMAGGFLAIGSAVSAATKSQVIAFVISVVRASRCCCWGFPPVQDLLRLGWAPARARAR